MQKFHKIETDIRGVWTTVVPYSFQTGDDKCKVFSETLPQLDNLGDALAHTWVGWVGRTPVIRCGNLNSNRKIQELWALVNEINRDLNSKGITNQSICRLSLNQLNSAISEDDPFALEHYLLATQEQSKDKILHYTSFLDNFYFSTKPEILSQKDLEELQVPLKLHNMDACITYCGIYNEMLQRVFSGFEYDDVDAYTIEKYVIAFEHEMQSPYLPAVKSQIIDLQRVLFADEELAKLTFREKENVKRQILNLRQELQDMVKALFENLVEFVRIIPIIQDAHPELKSLKEKGILLKTLLGSEIEALNQPPLSFTNQQYLLQLLNDDMGIISAVHCSNGVERTNIAFAVRLAVIQLKSSTSTEQIIDLGLNWDEAHEKIHHCIAERGVEKLEAWIQDLEVPQFRTRIQLLLQFWDLFYSNLISFCKPITLVVNHNQIARPRVGGYLNREFLEIMPPFVKQVEHNIQKYQMLIKYDSQSHQTRDFTKFGHSLLNALSSTS